MGTENQFVALMSVDWADQDHQGCLQLANSESIEDFSVEQKPASLEEWVGKLRKRFKGGRIAVAIEQKRGNLIHFLMKYELFVIFPLNTTAVKNYRKALRASGAKDDVSDARIQLLFLRNHIGQLRVIEPDSTLTRQLRMLVEARRKTVNRSTAISNQITALLKEYYPTALELVGDLKTNLACELLSRWPSLEAIKRIKPEQLRAFFYKRNCRSRATVEARLRIIYEAVPLIEEAAILKSYGFLLKQLVSELKTLLKAIHKFEQEIELLFSGHPDAALYKSLPAAGPALEPRLAVIFGEDRTKFESAVAISNLIGVSPVTIKSGKKKTVVFRLAAPKFARQSLIEFAGHSVTSSVWAGAYYWKSRREGKNHNAAIRALAYKWIRILFRCWKDCRPYDEKIYLEALKRRNSPLAQLINAS